MDSDYLNGNYEDLKLILDLSFDLITISDGQGIFTAASKSCEQYFGLPEKQLIGMGPKDLEKNSVFDRSITAEVVSKREKITMVQKTASGKVLLVRAYPIFDEKREMVKIISFSKDITEEQSLSEKLEELSGELDWYKTELNKRTALDESKTVYLSDSMNQVIKLIHHVANLATTVMLLGETGVGKGYYAKLIHDSSEKRAETFVTINCGAIPKELLETELFGYEEGAFTGAKKQGKKGLFEIAGEGTIFLDEIGDMPMELQVKLLNFLDKKEIFRIGGTSAIKVNARIITATHRDLRQLIREGKFREDLYYRLNVVPVTIPPLRKRREDIPIFINMFLNKFNDEYQTDKRISQAGYILLNSFGYPGNVRELEHIVERLVVVSAGDFIDETLIGEVLETIEGPNMKMYQEPLEITSLKEEVEKLERKIIANALKKYKTTRKVGEALKIDQSTVVKKIQKLKIGIDE